MPGTTSTTQQQSLESLPDQPSDPTQDFLNINTNEEYVIYKKKLRERERN